MLKKTPIIICIALVTLALFAIGTAMALNPGDIAEPKVTVKVVGGTLSWLPSGNSNLNDVLLDGTDQVTTGTLSTIQVTDARGKKIGWYMTATATQFEDVSDPANTIVGTFEVLNPVVVNPVTGNGGVTGTGGDLYGGLVLMDTDAGDGDGRGINETAPTMELQVPAETLDGTYTSTVTETLLSYP